MAKIKYREPKSNEVRRTLAGQADWLYTHNIIPEKSYNRFRQGSILGDLADKLVSEGKHQTKGQRGVSYKLLTLREFGKDDFYLPVIVPNVRLREKVACFVGHRDSPEMRRSFQYNVATLLREFHVISHFQDVNYLTEVIFSRVVKEIEKSHFCIFDNRDTENKPNVYVEIGVAKVLRTPIVFFEKTSKAGKQLKGFPSDFAGFSTFQYTSYKKLFSEFGLQLPVLLGQMGLYRKSQ